MPTSPSTTVIKAFKVLELFREHPLIGASECGRLLDMPRASAYRMLLSLERAGVLEATGSGQYRLGLRLFELGYLAPKRRRLFDHAYLPMEQLVTKTNLPVILAILDDHEALFLLKVWHAPDRLSTRAGQREPLHATSVGKVLLAHAPPTLVKELLDGGLTRYTAYTLVAPAALLKQLGDVRDSGIAYDHEERQIGLSSIACPVRDRRGAVVAALAISAPTERYGRRMETLVSSLRQAAEAAQQGL